MMDMSVKGVCLRARRMHRTERVLGEREENLPAGGAPEEGGEGAINICDGSTLRQGD